MLDRKPVRPTLADSERHLASAERRVFLAMKKRDGAGAGVGDEDLTRLFDELVAAIATHRMATSRTPSFE